LSLTTVIPADSYVTSASLYYCEAAAQQAIPHVTVSTIQADWGEGTSSGWATSEGGSCYNYAKYYAAAGSRINWSWSGSRFPDVAYGNSYSLVDYCPTQYQVGSDTYYRWDIDPDLVNAGKIGAAYGLALFESSGDNLNRVVYSDESGSVAYLVLTTVTDTVTPGAVTGLSATTTGVDRSEIKLTWTVPAGAFAYRVTASGPGFTGTEELPRYLIPFAGPQGSTEEMIVKDLLTAGASYTFTVIALSRSGTASDTASVVQAASSIDETPGQGESIRNPFASVSDYYETHGLRVWVVPETEKVKHDGTFQSDDNIPADYKKGNPCFNGTTVLLEGAKNEIVSFLVCLEAVTDPITDISVELDLNYNVDGRRYRVGYINTSQGYMPEVIYPYTGPVATNMDENCSTVQKVQQVLVELLIDSGVTIPDNNLNLIITAGDTINLNIPIELHVWNFTIPDTPTFTLALVDMGYPDYVATFNELQRAARQDRAHINTQDYYNGNTSMDMWKLNAVKMDEAQYNNIAELAVTTYWTDFITVFDPALSGTLFSDGQWQNTPTGSFHLSHTQSWPRDYSSYYSAGEDDAFAAFPNANYGQTFANLVSDFVTQAENNGWTGTTFQVALLDKDLPWDYDEPWTFWDFNALRYFATLFDSGTVGNTTIDMKFRIDISQPQYHRNLLYGMVDLGVVNEEWFNYHQRIITPFTFGDTATLWSYQPAHRVHKSNHNHEARVLESYALGASGSLVWSSVGATTEKDYLGGATDAEQQIALYIIATDGQSPTVYSTLRMKAMRRGAQDAEYLKIMQDECGYTTGQVQRMITSDISGIPPSSPPLDLTGVSEADFFKLRYRAAKLIEGQVGAMGAGTLGSDFTWYVNDNNLGGDQFASAVGNNANSGQAANLPKLTLAAVAPLLTYGDTLYIDAGTYNESDSFLISVSNLWVIGVDSATTVIDFNDTSASSLLALYAGNVSNLTIRDIGIIDGYRGIWWDNVDGSTLLRVRADTHGGQGFYFANGANQNTVTNCQTRYNGEGGSPSGFLLEDCNQNTITGHFSADNGASGIGFGGSDMNTVTGGTILDNATRGFFLNTGSDSNTITGNYIRNSGDGIVVQSADLNYFGENTCETNTNGFYLHTADSNIINNNSGFDNTTAGIDLNTTCLYNSINGNTMALNTVGIRMMNSSNENLVSYNYCFENTNAGLAFANASNNVLTANSCETNAKGFNLNGGNDGNTFTDNNCRYNTEHGFYLSNSDQNILTGNTADSNTDNGFYLLASSTGNTLQANVASANQTGFLFSAASNNLVTQNSGRYNLGYQFTVTGASLADTFLKNVVLPSADNPDSGINCDASGWAFDLTRCWWSTSDSTGVRAMIHGTSADSAIYSPYRFGTIDTAAAADTIAPNAPDSIAAEVNAADNSCTFNWTAPALNEEVGSAAADIAGYRLYRDTAAAPDDWGTPLAEITGLNYCDSGLSDNATYYYRLTAYDNHSPWANESWLSDTVISVMVNATPVARAGADTVCAVSDSITIDGSTSSDSEGDTTIVYLWSSADSGVTIGSAADSVTYALFDTYAYFCLTLSVSDGMDTTVDTLYVDVPSTKTGDFTSEGASYNLVDDADYLIFCFQAYVYWLLAPADARTDLTGDGVIDFEDVAEFARYYGK